MKFTLLSLLLSLHDYDNVTVITTVTDLFQYSFIY